MEGRKQIRKRLLSAVNLPKIAHVWAWLGLLSFRKYGSKRACQSEILLAAEDEYLNATDESLDVFGECGGEGGRRLEVSGGHTRSTHADETFSDGANSPLRTVTATADLVQNGQQTAVNVKKRLRVDESGRCEE